MGHSLKMGVSQAVITPPVGTLLFGYTPDVVSTSVHDDLTVTVLYFRDGDEQALLVNVTVCELDTSLCERLGALTEERYGISREHCILHATHTHSGPTLVEMFGWGEINYEYFEQILEPRFLACVGEAIAGAQEVRMGVAVGESRTAVNRRELCADNHVALGQNPWGAMDPRMTLLSFFDLQGKCLATVVHYAMHGTCAGKNTEISRDWSGVMVDELEREGAGTVAFFNGPEGDIGPRLTNGATTGNGDARYIDLHGAWAARDAVEIFRGMRGAGEASLSVYCGDVHVPLDHRPTREEALAAYEQYKGSTVNIDGARAKHYEEIVASYETGYCEIPYRSFRQTAIRIGGVAFVTFPYELFSEIGLRIAHEVKDLRILSLSLANGAEGYFVSEDQICRGGYEVGMFKYGNLQPYADSADHALVTETLKNLSALSRGE